MGVRRTLKLSEAVLMNPKFLTEGNSKLTLINKSIADIDYIESQKLLSLQVLDLSNNMISEIPDYLSTMFPNLTTLILSHNQISQLFPVLTTLSNLPI